MGTYTTNKNLFMPTVGETGWGDLVNGNFSTIDTFLKPITVSGSTYTFTGNYVGNQSGGSVSATTGTFSGAVTGATINGATITSTKFNGVLLKQNINVTPTSTFDDTVVDSYVHVLAPIPNVTYSGSINYQNVNSNKGYTISLVTGDSNQKSIGESVTYSQGVKTFTFSNVPFLAIKSSSTNVKISTFTFS